MSVVHSNYTEAQSLSFNAVDIFGLPSFPYNMTVDGNRWNNYLYNQTTLVKYFISLCSRKDKYLQKSQQELVP